MDHSGHPATHGNSARSNAANTENTNIGPATASFMAAYGSPFTNVDDLIPQGARVVDPETTERTCTTSITARLNIPVVADPTNTEGKLLLIMSADPLAQLPLWLSRRYFETTATVTNPVADVNTWNENGGSGTGNYSLCDAASWGQTYEKIGLDDFFAQTTDLGNLSMKHRVVGCAMRANIGVDTTLSRGSIEAGQFNWSDTRFIPNQAMVDFTTVNNVGKASWWQAHFKPGSAFVPEGQPAVAGIRTQKGLGTLMLNNAYNKGEAIIRSARTQDYGTLDADKGASVRWTDTNDFKFQRTVNRNIVCPDRQYYANGIVTNIAIPGTANAWEDNPTATTIGREIQAFNCNAYRGSTTGDALNDSRYAPDVQPSKLAYKRYNDSGDAFKSGALMIGADNEELVELCNGTTTYKAGTTDVVVGTADKSSLGTDTFEPFFDKGLYLDITGVAPTQWVNVDLVWHIEYVPKSWALTRGIYPPVDMQFDMLASMLGDPKQFPIVVMGNSFFTSLWRGIKRAADTAASIAGTAGSAIESAGSVIDPRLALLGGALKAGAATYKKIRHM